MKISINELRYYRDLYKWAGDPAPEGADKIAHRIGAQLGAIEEIIDSGSKYQGVLIVKVISCQQHPNADRLHVCKIDDGGKAQGVERDENGHVQVVCGAPNVRAGLTVVWLPPGSTVPESVDKEPFVLEARELRGIISNGMLASSRELALGDSHEGILEIDGEIASGTDFAEHFNLARDAVLDIENKMFTHRPDCFGLMGVAREVAGIQQQSFHSPDWYKFDISAPGIEAEALPLEIRNELPELVPRFVAIAMSSIEIKPSPVWMQVSLSRVGFRPINNVVDITNYIMYLTGQPIHAYDYDKVKALSDDDKATIVVRHPQEGEKITLLNGKEIEPRDEAIMIATDQKLIGIGGVMGGADAEVDETTKNIIIEVANFDMYSIRRTSMAHGLFTDAVTRFNKGQSPLQNRAVLAKMVDEVRKSAGGKVASELIDHNHLPEDVMQRGSVHAPVTVSAQFINERLGLKLSIDEMRNLLANVEFDVQVEGDTLTVKAPFWRTDIEIPEDIVEEVGRLYGFDHLPLELPSRPMTPAAKNSSFELKQRLRDTLSQAGANEILSYSFVHGNLLQKAGQDVSHAFQLSNALSPDLQYYRLSLMPSLLERVHANIKAGYDELALFEIGKVHSKDELDEEGLPKEFERLALVFAADDKTTAAQYQGAAYYQALQYLERLVGTAHYRYLPLHEVDVSAHELTHQMVQPFEPNRSAVIHNGERVVGVVGEYRPSVRKALKLPEFSAGFEVFASDLAEVSASAYKPLSRFPGVEQDICLKVPTSVSYEQVFGLVQSSIDKRIDDDMTYDLSSVDIYQRSDDSAHKQITLRLAIANYAKTLRDSEVSALLDEVASDASTELQAERI